MLAYDGHITLPSGKTDAIFLEIRNYGKDNQTLFMAIPYRHASFADGFAVHRPKFLGFDWTEEADCEGLAKDFFKGVDSHGEASKVWEAHREDSI